MTPHPLGVRLRRAVSVAALFAVLAACAPGARAPDAEIASATPIADVFGPRFELLDSTAAIERFDPPGAGAGLVLAFTTTVRNPNEFPVTLDRIDYAVRLQGTEVARSSQVPDLTLGPGASAPLVWRVDADLAPHRALWRPVVDAFAGTPLPFTLEGTVRFSSQSYAFTTGARTIVEGGALATHEVRAPRLRLDGRDSRITVLRVDAPVVTLVLLATNVGDVGYFVSGSGLQLQLNDAVVATADLGPLPVPAGETSRVELVFIVDRARLDPAGVAALDAALEGRAASVVLRGGFAYDVLGVDSYPVPIGDGLATTIPGPAPASERTLGGAADDGIDGEDADEAGDDEADDDEADDDEAGDDDGGADEGP